MAILWQRTVQIQLNYYSMRCVGIQEFSVKHSSVFASELKNYTRMYRYLPLMKRSMFSTMRKVRLIVLAQNTPDAPKFHT